MKDNVLRLDVAMNNLVRMELIDSLAYLPHDARHFSFRHWLQFFELLEQLAACPHFQQDINIGLIVEETVHSDDIGMI